ncbi:hypothetical protein [Bacillus sp. FJAT-27225]|nr:hypothetical protein [Bacillus sp. FJAT-27225]
MTKSKRPKNKITSIQYVHDPEAAKEWMNVFMDVTMKHFLSKGKNKD